MKFELTEEQRDFAASLDALLSSADSVGAARAWAAGDHGPGLKLWARLADQGVHALLVPEEHGGMGATLTELAIAAEALGHHAVPGPWAESVAWLPMATDDSATLEAVAAGTLGSVQIAPHVPFAVDADVAEILVSVVDGRAYTATAGELVASLDPTRRLHTVTAGDAWHAHDLGDAFDVTTLFVAAQLLGAGERVLEEAVTYVRQRTQFGRPIGSYQAIKHKLADVRIALDFARPLVWGAALSPEPRDVSAAKVAAGDAAYLAARAALQVHGAIGYTQEHDLSLWLLRIRALVGAWGTTAWHRQRVLDSLVGASE